MIKSNFFNMGQIVATRSVNEYMEREGRFATEVMAALQKFAVKDWGNLDDEDKQTNEDALNYPEDLYLLGAYDTSKGKIWIITNNVSEFSGDTVTTVCFPEER